MTEYYLEIAYIIAIVLFMMGLKKLGHPQTAQKGNMQAGIGMGIAILAISSDLEEVLRISDRVLVMHKGILAGQLNRDQLTEETIMHLATGTV